MATPSAFMLMFSHAGNGIFECFHRTQLNFFSPPKGWETEDAFDIGSEMYFRTKRHSHFLDIWDYTSIYCITLSNSMELILEIFLVSLKT